MARPSVASAVFVDFETFANDQYNLSRMSSRAYIEDPRFDVLSVAIASGTGPIRVFHKLACSGEGALIDGIDEMRDLLARGLWLVCHNARFDGLVLRMRFGITPFHIFDTQDYAAYLGLGTSLANVAWHVELRKEEHPPFNEESLRDPVLLAQLLRYNAMDVRVTRRAFERAVADFALPDAEFDIVDATERNNIQGLCLDRERAAEVAQQLVAAKNDLISEIARAYPLFDTSKLGSNPAVSAFIEKSFGIRPPSLDKKDPELVNFLTERPAVGNFLERRQLVTTLRKYASQVTRYAQLGGRVYSPLRYCGAHTGRFSGGGRDSDKLNIQNLPKAKRAPHPAVGLIRTLVVPEPGANFVAADLSTIEARVIATLAGEEAMLRIFREHGDIYIWFGSLVFPGVRIVKDGENDHLRRLCKEAVLALGFGMGCDLFLERVRFVDRTLLPEDIRRVFETYRSMFARIAQLRRDYWGAFRRAADYGEPLQVGRCIFSRVDQLAGPTVEIHLPTGRRLFYRSIETTDVIKPWGPGQDYWYCSDFDYQVRLKKVRGPGKTRRSPDGRLRKIVNAVAVVENIVQAVARDILMHQMLEVENRGPLRPTFHLHDELVCECAACRCQDASDDTRSHDPGCAWVMAGAGLVAGMSRIPTSLPGLADIPIGAELLPCVRSTYGG